jgi:hypothetical protein
LQQLGTRHRWVLLRKCFVQSPDQLYDTDIEETWSKEYVHHEISRLEETVYGLLQEGLQDFASSHPIFRCHRVGHQLCVLKQGLVRFTRQVQTTTSKQQRTSDHAGNMTVTYNTHTTVHTHTSPIHQRIKHTHGYRHTTRWSQQK